MSMSTSAGATMQPLTQVPLAGHLLLLPAGWTHATARARLAALLAQAAGPESANLFAEAAPKADAVAFLAPPGRVARFAELDAGGRALLRSEIGRLASSLRRAAEAAAARDSQGAGGLPALVAAALELPSFELVFAHEGRPLLAGWGMAPAGAPAGLGLIHALDDGQPGLPAGRPLPRRALALGALALLLIGGASALAAPWLAPRLAPAAPACQIRPGSLDAMLALLREQDREQDLRRRIADLQDDLGRRRAACPLRQEQAPAPPPQPAPPPRAAQPPSPPSTQPCNTDSQSGGRGVTSNRHYLGPDPGRVVLGYNTRSEPDRIRVLHRGQVIAETGFVSGTGSIAFDWRPPANAMPEDLVVTVEVTGRPGSSSTVWNYRLACPAR